MQHAAIWVRACGAGMCWLALGGSPVLADDLCGRPREAPDALLQRLTKTEGLAEGFRDKAYVTVHDAAKRTLWTFTVAGHPAHPSVVCRRPVEEGGKVRLEMGVQCGASGDQCERLVRAFAGLNAKMLKDAEQQSK